MLEIHQAFGWRVEDRPDGGLNLMIDIPDQHRTILLAFEPNELHIAQKLGARLSGLVLARTVPGNGHP